MKWTVLVLALAVVACGPSMRNDDDNFGGDGGGSGGGGGGGGGGSGDDGCSAASKLVYVVDQNNTLSQYDPTTKMFHDLGTLSCNAGNGFQPFSMGVDRNATAYVLFVNQSQTDGTVLGTKLFKVDTTAAGLPCTATAFTAPSSLKEFGMGFSTTTAGGDVDQLFIAGGSTVTPGSNSSLNTLDVTSFMATPVGQANNIAGDPELTGNSNGELWGFLPNATSPKIEQINKTNGTAIAPANLPSSMQGDPLAWAFAFFGGNYYVFLMKDTSGGIFPETSTTVYEVSPTGQLMSSTPTNTRVIVGAGVSTCAPIVISRQ